MAQSRCSYCGRWFRPKPRKGPRQVTCGAAACRAEHKRALGRRWRADNPEQTLGRQGKVRAWAKDSGYWKTYRLEHPEQAQHNRVQSRERMRQLRQDRRRARALLADPVGYLKGLKARCGEGVCKTGTGQAPASTRNDLTAEGVCKTGTGGEPVVEIVDYLLARELFAKQEGLAPEGAAAG